MTSNKITIGRSVECNLVLADMTVSRHHAEIELLENNDLLLTDCQSTQGTFMIKGAQEERIKQKLITTQDFIKFGNITMSVKEILVETGLIISTRQSPESITINPAQKNSNIPLNNLSAQSTLAKRSTRLYAAIIDLLIGIVTCIPGLIFYKYIDESFGFGVIGLSYLALLIAQMYFMVTLGQSLGKCAVGIKVVRIADEGLPGFSKIYLLRHLVPGLIGAIPYVGAVFVLVDYLFIFRDDNRCIHDLIAQTKVINDPNFKSYL